MPFKSHSLDSFTKGWFVGNYSPTPLPTEDIRPRQLPERTRHGPRTPGDLGAFMKDYFSSGRA